MKHLLLLLSFSLSLALTAAAQHDVPSGTWKGAIELPDAELAIVVTLEQGADGWAGTIDIPAQGLTGFALSAVAVEEGRVHFEMAGVPGQPTFDGELASTGDAIAGSFRQGPQTFPFSLGRAAAEPEPAEDSAPDPGVPGEGLVGEWLGTLVPGPMHLRLVLRVTAAADGTLTATLDSVDQGAVLPVASLAFEERTLRFTIESIGASFSGTMNGDGSAIEGTWSQGRELPLTLRRQAEAFALVRPQEPRPPFPYESRDVRFPNPDAGIRLAGTLVVPDGDGPFPTVLMVTGSGPQDRDESLMGHKPFLVLADHLARRGIASLRYDDRGVGDSDGSFATATVADLASDVAAGVAYLAEQAQVARDAIGIVGHSEGGLSAPRVAAENGEIDFLVLLAPPGEPLESLVLRQLRDTLRWQGLEEELIERAVARRTENLALIGDPSIPTDELTRTLGTRAATRGERYTPAELDLLGLDAAAVERSIAEGTTPWFRSLVREDPAVHLRKIRIPVLALFGTKDLQVVAEVNAPLVRAALEAAENPDFEVRVLPDLNHLFQHAGSGSPAEYGTIEETFAPEALELVATWIGRRFSGAPAAGEATAAARR